MVDVQTVALFSDGGLCHKNPSPIGGASAFVLVDPTGVELGYGTATITPQEAGLPWISCNVVEVMGITLGLEAIPEGTRVRVMTDSKNALNAVATAFRSTARPEWIPEPLWLRTVAAKVKRWADLNFTLLKGHPTRRDLKTGHPDPVFCGLTSRGKRRPVSRFNVRADKLCQEACRELAAKLAAV